MTVQELYYQTAQLGFEDSLEDGARFYSAANRALLQVAAVRPETRLCFINHNPMPNMLTEQYESLDVTENITYSANGAKSFFFKACGKGEVRVEYLDNGEWQIYGTPINIDTEKNEYRCYRGFIPDEENTRLAFYAGEYLYLVSNVALYKHKISDELADIPDFEAFTRYNVAEMVSDFWGIVAPPIKSDMSKLTTGYNIESECIIVLPRTSRGMYQIEYKHKPEAINASDAAQNNTSKIDLAEDLAVLMPLLVASYVWLEDSPDKAQYYLTLYREGTMNIERRSRKIAPVQIETNGWG